MPEIFNDPEFEKYLMLQIEEGVNLLRDVVNSDKSPEYFRGAMTMLRKTMSVPTKMVPAGSSQKDQADMLRAKAFAAFEAKMIRKFVQEE